VTPTSWSKVVKSNLAVESPIAAYAMREVPDAPYAAAPRGPAGSGHLGPLEQIVYERGFAAGEQAGRDAVSKELESTRRALGALISELASLQTTIPADHENDLITLAFAVAERIVGEELPRHPQATAAYIRDAAAALGRADRIVIKVHPSDLERLTREIRTLEPRTGPEFVLRFEADPRLRPGECIAETTRQSVDARISSQLGAIERQIRREDHGP
jgi:flagellar assembly protein FliH